MAPVGRSENLGGGLWPGLLLIGRQAPGVAKRTSGSGWWTPSAKPQQPEVNGRSTGGQSQRMPHTGEGTDVGSNPSTSGPNGATQPEAIARLSASTSRMVTLA